MLRLTVTADPLTHQRNVNSFMSHRPTWGLQAVVRNVMTHGL